MKKRILFLIKLYAAFLLIFIMDKPLFMLYNHAAMPESGFTDYLQVMLHGLTLDFSVTGYLMVFPVLLTMMSIWISVPFRGILIPYYIVVSFIIATVFVADMSLYEFWKFKIDSNIFFYLQTPQEAMASVSSGYILLRVLVIFLFAAAIFLWLRSATPKREELASTHRILCTIVILLFSPILFITIRGGLGESTANVGRVYYSVRQEFNHSAVNPLFNLIYSTLKAEDFAAQFNFYSEEERAERFGTLFPPKKKGEKTALLLRNKRPNILLIVWESFARYFTDAREDSLQITPGFNRLASQGILFTNCYANSYRTDRGLVSILSGHLSYPTASIMKNSAKSRTLPSLAVQLDKEGYDTDFFYGGDINFTNMQGYLRSTGYNRVTGEESFTSAERKTNAWGVNDDIVFDKLYDMLTAKRDTLWFTTLLTLSSHEPFIVPYRRLSDGMENAMAYTDSCLYDFTRRLSRTDVWDNLLIIVVGDHGYHRAGSSESWRPHYFQTPMLWTGGAVKEAAQIDTLMMQSDIAATLFAQMDMESKDFIFSRNILSSDYTNPFAYYTFNNGFGFADRDGISVYDNESGRLLTQEQLYDTLRIASGKALLQTTYDDLGKR